LPMLPLMPKGSIDRLADVPIRWLVLGFLILAIGTFVKLWIDGNNYDDRYNLAAEGETLRVAVGEELDLTLQTVGPGEYQSPPRVSSSSLQFLDAAPITPTSRWGIAQVFRFKGAIPGQAIVVIHHSGKSPVISDTVNVH